MSQGTLALYEAYVKQGGREDQERLVFDELSLPLYMANEAEQIRGLRLGQERLLRGDTYTASVMMIDRIPNYQES